MTTLTGTTTPTVSGTYKTTIHIKDHGAVYAIIVRNMPDYELALWD